MHRSHAIVLTAAACSGGIASAPPTTEHRPAAVVSIADAAVLDAVPIDATPADAASATPAIAAGCRGAELLLSKTGAQRCVVGGAPQDALPAGLVASIEPSPLRLETDHETTIAVVLTNPSAEAVTLLLGCGDFGWDRYEIVDKRGRRVDVAGDCVPGGGGCGGPTYGFAIEPGGQARYELAFTTRIEDTCGGAREKPVPKGTYELRVYTGLAGEQRLPIKIY